MKIDITLKLNKQIIDDSRYYIDKSLTGHHGTHFDVMNKEFPIDYTERKGIIFDVSAVSGRDIDVYDINIDKIYSDMFVAFYTGYIEAEGYGSKKYFKEHPQLSNELITLLIDKKISIIGIDFAGIRRGQEHKPIDQYCADNNVFVVENLCNLNQIIDNCNNFVAHTYPMNFTDISGLPCRVVAEL